MPCPAAVMNAVLPASLPLIEFLLVLFAEYDTRKKSCAAETPSRVASQYPARRSMPRLRRLKLV
jgi:hypothetical protein